MKYMPAVALSLFSFALALPAKTLAETPDVCSENHFGYFSYETRYGDAPRLLDLFDLPNTRLVQIFIQSVGRPTEHVCPNNDNMIPVLSLESGSELVPFSTRATFVRSTNRLSISHQNNCGFTAIKGCYRFMD